MPRSGPEELSTYADGLQKLPFVRSVALHRIPPGVDPAFDTIADLHLADGSTTRLYVDVKASHLLHSNAIPHWRTEAPLHLQWSGVQASEEGWLLAAPYIGAPLGDSLQQRGLNFIDREGNCYLRIGDRYMARIQGKTPRKRPARSKATRAPGYQVLFALLTDPELVRAPQREIARRAGTSKQPVVDLLRRLTEERLLVERRRRYGWVDGPDAKLLERWLEGYRSTLRPKLMVGRFRVPVREPNAIERWLEERVEGVQLGGTAGAYRLAPHYRGALTVAHLGPPSDVTRKALRALPSADGELVWMRHIGIASQNGETADTAHPLLIYAELASDPDPRAAEAAELIRERFLPWSL